MRKNRQIQKFKKISIYVLTSIITAVLLISFSSSILIKQIQLTSSGSIEYTYYDYAEGLNVLKESTLDNMSLYVDGNKIKNFQGQTISLRGFNVMGQFHGNQSGEWDSWGYYNSHKVDNFFDRMQELGVNVVREMTNVESWILNPVVNSNLEGLTVRAMYKDFIERAKLRGIYVILQDYTVKPYPAQDIEKCGYGIYSTDDEREVLPTRQDFIDYLTERILELGVYDNYIAEFWNEPFGGSEAEAEEWQTAWQSIITRIRTAGYTGIILVQHSTALGLWGDPHDTYRNLEWYYSYPINDPLNNMMVGFHFYREFVSGYEVADADKIFSYEDIKIALESLHVKEISLSVPLICGEIGARLSNTLDMEFLINSLDLFNEWDINYLGWTLSTCTFEAMLQTGTSKSDVILNLVGEKIIDAITTGSRSD